MARSRRSVLKTIGAAAFAGPLAAQHQHAAEALVQIAGQPKPPAFFSKEQMDTLAVLVDLILPRTDTPGAADAGVHRIIDSSVKKSIRAQKEWRAGLAWLESEAQISGVKAFRGLPEAEQIALLRRASAQNGTPGAKFFRLLKNATIDAYYSTREGLTQELGWHGNTYLPEFKGCTHPEHQS